MMHVKSRPSRRPTRMTISLSRDQKKELQRLADAKKVSLAWIIRDAIDRYLFEDAPLLYKKSE